MKTLTEIITSKGEKFPKKHGEWYCLHIYDDNYLVLDTWNGNITYHKECKSTGTDNMYGVVYTFTGEQCTIRGEMISFWHKHAQLIN